MRTLWRRIVLAALLIAIGRVVAAETLAVPGSGSPEVILNELAHAYNAAHPDDVVEIPPSSRSVGALRQLQHGEAVLGRVSRRPTPDEGRGLVYLPFARDAVVFAVGRGVTVTSLSPGQLADVFAGRLSNWKALGGKDAPIRVLVRNETESNHRIILEHLPSFRELRYAADAKLVYHTHEMMTMLGKFPSSIGYVSNSSLHGDRKGIRALALDGKAPTPAAVADGSYPLQMEFGLIYRDEGLSPLARRFLDFIFSSAGSKILRANGLIPLPRRPQSP